MLTKPSLLWLTQQISRTRPSIDAAVIAAQLGVLPDLSYLVEGLRRSRQCIHDFHDELSECLRAVPGPRHEPRELLDAIDHLLDWCETQHWREEDLPMLRMGRPNTSASHPLKGHCLSVAFHWPNLFYTFEPDEQSARDADAAAVTYEALMAEFTMYVIAAQSTIDPCEYLDYCKKWLSSQKLPPRTAFPDRRLGSRVATASRAMRRLGLHKHHELYEHLADRKHGDHFHARVSSALRRKRKWGEGDFQVLNSIALLVEEVRPGWSRTGHTRRRAAEHKRSGAHVTRRRQYQDGYVRVLGNAVRAKTTTEAGLEIEHTRPLPTSVEALSQELIIKWQGQIDSDPKAPAAREHFVNGKRPTVAQLRVEAENEAKILVDGMEWIPTDEAGDNPGLESVVIGQEIDGDAEVEPRRSTSRWAVQHIRRAQFAHGLGPNRLIQADAKRLLECIRSAPAHSADTAALVALHASLALGRPVDKVAAMLIHEGEVPPGADRDRIHYSIASQEWTVPCPAPAWLAMEPDPDERLQFPTLSLRDRTGFADLLQHFDLARGGQLIAKFTERRKRAARAFVNASLPHAGATLTQCSDYLFYQLLACSQGDLGIATVVTGHDHSHSSSVRHYANYPAPQAWDAYRKAWNFEEGTSEASGSASLPADHANGIVSGIGARRVPTSASVQRAFAGLAHTVRFGESLSERQNAYTAYTLAGLVLALGMRPVVAPLIRDIVECAGDGLLPTYIDKARSDYDRRVNAIPKQLADHLYRYVTFREHLVVTGPERVTRAGFIYIDPEGKHERFRPSDFLKVTRGLFTLELYALRRFVRTELRCTYRVHAEDVDAWMGHWFHRLSPHDRLSTYPLQRLRVLADGAISSLLEQVGFRPVAPPR